MNQPLQIITRKEAKEQGLTRYYTGEPCKHGHVDERKTSDGGCYTCKRIRSKAYKQMPAGRASHRASNKKYMQTPEGRAVDRVYQEVYREQKREEAPHIRGTHNVARNYPSAIVPLTKKEQKELEWFYKAAQRATRSSGVQHEVDHCYPLSRGGLHHPLNLMVLPAFVNRSKGGKFLPDSPLAVRGK